MSDRPVAIRGVGGLVEETGVCLAVYGEDLDPAAVTSLLGCSPTSSHRPPYEEPGEGSVLAFSMFAALLAAMVVAIVIAVVVPIVAALHVDLP